MDDTNFTLLFTVYSGKTKKSTTANAYRQLHYPPEIKQLLRHLNEFELKPSDNLIDTILEKSKESDTPDN